VEKSDKMSAGALAKQFALGVKKVTVDAGHGGDDFGAPGYMKGVHEKDIVLILSKKLANKLKSELGCEVIMTRDSDKYLTLEERTAIANTKNSDIFISLHTNAARNKNAFGIETYYLNLATDDESILVAARENATSTKNISDLQSILNDLMQNAKINESSRLAGHVQDSLFKKLKSNYNNVKNKGVKKAPFYVLLGAQMPAILIETSFISNKRECLRLLDPDYQELLCDAIINGVRNYMKEINPNALIGPPVKSGKGG
jgi:N-acetylmuramoyl-L-alanine amidase